ncbi:hypothetical protein CBR_g9086 [Chara braunii]|uniref:Uncharacterized protein n=1 Tax=Chara braunii TaxID=69332 RepID=A0A388KNQ1_CHABU|nr:hypothetical protein CBR_g9086 [Chara braunii]|eukprot:GBG71672.1 hypothetical protein CBR_g9086 [Chara braunii]
MKQQQYVLPLLMYHLVGYQIGTGCCPVASAAGLEDEEAAVCAAAADVPLGGVPNWVANGPVIAGVTTGDGNAVCGRTLGPPAKEGCGPPLVCMACSIWSRVSWIASSLLSMEASMLSIPALRILLVFKRTAVATWHFAYQTKPMKLGGGGGRGGQKTKRGGGGEKKKGGGGGEKKTKGGGGGGEKKTKGGGGEKKKKTGGEGDEEEEKGGRRGGGGGGEKKKGGGGGGGDKKTKGGGGGGRGRGRGGEKKTKGGGGGGGGEEKEERRWRVEEDERRRGRLRRGKELEADSPRWRQQLDGRRRRGGLLDGE